MDAQLEAKLIECLDALAQGEPVERILARYPQDAAQLRPLLETANGLPALRLEPSEAAKIKSRHQFMAQADLLRRTTPRQSIGFLPRFLAGFAAVAVIAIVLGTGAVAASSSALPGDPLYGLKRTVEEVRLQSASSPAQRQELEGEFEQRRVDETNELLNAGREGEIEFTGVIEVIQPNAWIVSSLVVQIDANTQISGQPQIDRLAEVRGMTGPRGLRASSISIEPSGEPVITPTPVMIAPTVIETPTPPWTPAATITVTPQMTLNPPTVAPTATLTPRPTATPQPVEVEFTGTVNAIDAETWIIDGTTIVVNAATEIRDNLTIGQRVKVKALRLADGRLVATRLELSDDGGNENDATGNDRPSSNENQNADDGNSNDNDNANDDNDDDGNEDNGNDDNDNSNDNENDN